MAKETTPRSTWRALLHYNASTGFRQRLRAALPAWLELDYVEPSAGGAVLGALAGTDVLLHVLTPVTAAFFAAAPRLKLVQKIGVGTNTIDLETAQARGVAVCNMPGSNSQAVAEHTLALMLAVLRRLREIDPPTRAGKGWTIEPGLYDGVGEICGRTVGFVGYGSIPRKLTAALVALGAKVIYFSRHPVPDAEAAPARWVPELRDLLAEADVVSLHLPLTPQTANLLDAGAIAAMRPGAILINTARGGLVEESALVAALRSGHIAAAGLDVFASEPAGAGNPLFQLANVVVTPHIAWLTPETLDRYIAVIADNVRRLRAGEPLLHRVV